MPNPSFAIVVCSTGIMALGAATVSAQDYPSRPIRIVTSGIGGGSDFTSRLLAPGLSLSLGQPVVVDNHPNTLISIDVAAKALPDGQTLTVQGATLWVGPLLRKLSYDPIRDFSPITQITREVQILAVHPSLAANSIKELIALAKAKPGELNYGSSGVGGPAHIAVELFNSMAGVNIRHVPYKTGPLAINGILGGEAQMIILDAGVLSTQVKSGKLKALAVTSAEPSVLYPGLPTIAASGVPGYEMVGMTGILVPAKTPAAIINRLNRELVRIINQAEIKERLLNAGGEVVANTPEQFAAEIKADMDRKSKVIKDADIKAD